jgi:hypothetical protein
LGSDLLVFSDPISGDDATITEKKRILAALDLPRPAMLINAWVMQNSTADAKTFGEVARIVRRAVHEHNDGLDRFILDEWSYLKTQMENPTIYFDLPFYNYVARRVIFDAGLMAGPPSKEVNLSEQAQRLLSSQSSSSRGADLLNGNGKLYAGACDAEKYCLGYTTLFQPLQPKLINLLLAMIAAADPFLHLNCAIDFMEGYPENKGCTYPHSVFPNSRVQTSELKQTAEKLQLDRKLKVNFSTPFIATEAAKKFGCEQGDQIGILDAMERDTGHQPRLFLECFRQIAAPLLRRENNRPNTVSGQPSILGLTRAAVANFLFNYKMSVQYPHEFVPYDLTLSADALNTALEPFIEAFNRDVAAYQGLLRARIGVEIDDLNKGHSIKRAFNLDKPTFLNDGIVTVNTISGSEATVNTTTQSYIDASTAPNLSALLSAISGAGSSSGNGGTTNLIKPLPGVLGNLSFNEVQVLAGAISAYQSSKAQIGRQLNVDFLPRSLVGASTAELQVSLKADDSTSPPIYSSGPLKGSDPEVSRFATNEITTRVRVDSLKLFEVSSFTAVLRNSRRRLPLLPPFVELPYIGTVAGVPLPAAREYHSSTAVLSAIVVPTATDLAYGSRFIGDRIIDEGSEPCDWPPAQTVAAQSALQNFLQLKPCKLRSAVSLSDFGGQPVREFHRMMVHCLSTEMRSANPDNFGYPPGEQRTCETLTYGKVFHESD